MILWVCFLVGSFLIDTILSQYPRWNLEFLRTEGFKYAEMSVLLRICPQHTFEKILNGSQGKYDENVISNLRSLYASDTFTLDLNILIRAAIELKNSSRDEFNEPCFELLYRKFLAHIYFQEEYERERNVEQYEFGSSQENVHGHNEPRFDQELAHQAPAYPSWAHQAEPLDLSASEPLDLSVREPLDLSASNIETEPQGAVGHDPVCGEHEQYGPQYNPQHLEAERPRIMEGPEEGHLEAKRPRIMEGPEEGGPGLVPFTPAGYMESVPIVDPYVAPRPNVEIGQGGAYCIPEFQPQAGPSGEQNVEIGQGGAYCIPEFQPQAGPSGEQNVEAEKRKQDPRRKPVLEPQPIEWKSLEPYMNFDLQKTLLPEGPYQILNHMAKHNYNFFREKCNITEFLDEFKSLIAPNNLGETFTEETFREIHKPTTREIIIYELLRILKALIENDHQTKNADCIAIVIRKIYISKQNEIKKNKKKPTKPTRENTIGDMNTSKMEQIIDFVTALAEKVKDFDFGIHYHVAKYIQYNFRLITEGTAETDSLVEIKRKLRENVPIFLDVLATEIEATPAEKDVFNRIKAKLIEH